MGLYGIIGNINSEPVIPHPRGHSSITGHKKPLLFIFTTRHLFTIMVQIKQCGVIRVDPLSKYSIAVVL